MKNGEEKLRITAVSYTNTLPFIYGLEHYAPLSGKIMLQLVPPAGCADAWHAGEADIALVPLGAMEESDVSKLCCNWCLGSEGPVESVLLMSETPLENLTVIYTDLESRTSVLLTQMLAHGFWGIGPVFRPLPPLAEFRLKEGEAMLLIGDKTFGIAHQYTHVTDIAEEWILMTGLPAVFACWIAREKVTPEMKDLFDRALGWGMENLGLAIKNKGLTDHEAERVHHYLTHCISYRFDQRKMDAVNTFFKYRRMLQSIPSSSPTPTL